MPGEPVSELKVTVRLFGVFRRARFKEAERLLPGGSCARDVVEDLGLSLHLLGTVLINDRHAKLDTELNDGDNLVLLPILDGG